MMYEATKFYFCAKYRQVGKTTITMIRHGETEWNVSMRLQGYQDSQLTQQGMQQVQQVAGALSKRSFNVLISSDQGRAVKTAEGINRHHNLNLILNKNMRERNFGIMEGLTREQIAQKFPEVHDGYMKRKSEYQVPDGESLFQLYSRVSRELKNMTELYKGNKILIVTHGGVLDCTMRMVFSIPLVAPRKFSIYNTAINTFSVKGNKWSLEEWGNIEHLKNLDAFDELS
jgi:probable phosphoglycerate mutase